MPEPDESIDSYARRLAALLPTTQKLVVGGASFGGIVALHVAKHTNPEAVVLIGSVRSPDELPWLVRMLRPVRGLVSLLPIRLLQVIVGTLASKSISKLTPHLSAISRQFVTANPQLVRWSLYQLLGWRESPQVNCPVFHIHGRRDRVLPVRYTSPDEVIESGGHVISMTHSLQVNSFLQQIVDTLGTRHDVLVNSHSQQ